MFPEGARKEVVEFFHFVDEDEKSKEGHSLGWKLLKALVLLTADSSVSWNVNRCLIHTQIYCVLIFFLCLCRIYYCV